MADDLRVEQVVTDSTEFIEFEGDCAYCLYNKCETESKEPVAVCSGGLAYYAHSTEYIFPHISCL